MYLLSHTQLFLKAIILICVVWKPDYADVNARTKLSTAILGKTGPLFTFVYAKIHIYIYIYITFSLPSACCQMDCCQMFVVNAHIRPTLSPGCAGTRVFVGTPGGGICRGLEVAEEPCLQPGWVNTHWAILCSLFGLPWVSATDLLYDHEGTNLSASHIPKHPMEMKIFTYISLVHGWSSMWAYTTPGSKDNGNGANILTLWKGTCGCLRNITTWRLLSPQNDAVWNPFKALHANSITAQTA